MTAGPIQFAPMPDAQGMFGEYGGQLVPPHLKAAMDEIASAVRTCEHKGELCSSLLPPRLPPS